MSPELVEIWKSLGRRLPDDIGHDVDGHLLTAYQRFCSSLVREPNGFGLVADASQQEFDVSHTPISNDDLNKARILGAIIRPSNILLDYISNNALGDEQWSEEELIEYPFERAAKLASDLFSDGCRQSSSFMSGDFSIEDGTIETIRESQGASAPGMGWGEELASYRLSDTSRIVLHFRDASEFPERVLPKILGFAIGRNAERAIGAILLEGQRRFADGYFCTPGAPLIKTDADFIDVCWHRNEEESTFESKIGQFLFKFEDSEIQLFKEHCGSLEAPKFLKAAHRISSRYSFEELISQHGRPHEGDYLQKIWEQIESNEKAEEAAASARRTEILTSFRHQISDFVHESIKDWGPARGGAIGRGLKADQTRRRLEEYILATGKFPDADALEKIANSNDWRAPRG